MSACICYRVTQTRLSAHNLPVSLNVSNFFLLSFHRKFIEVWKLNCWKNFISIESNKLFFLGLIDSFFLVKLLWINYSSFMQQFPELLYFIVKRKKKNGSLMKTKFSEVSRQTLFHNFRRREFYEIRKKFDFHAELHSETIKLQWNVTHSIRRWAQPRKLSSAKAEKHADNV